VVPLTCCPDLWGVSTADGVCGQKRRFGLVAEQLLAFVRENVLSPSPPPFLRLYTGGVVLLMMNKILLSAFYCFYIVGLFVQKPFDAMDCQESVANG